MSFPDAVVVQPGDQLLSLERKTDTPKAAREDGGDARTQSECQDLFGAWNSLAGETCEVVSVGPGR